MKELTQQRMKELLYYNPRVGVFDQRAKLLMGSLLTMGCTNTRWRMLTASDQTIIIDPILSILRLKD